MEASLSQVAVPVLKHHPFSVGLGVFDMGFDNGCGLFRSVSWAGSPRALPFPALLYSFSSEYRYPSASFRFSPATVILDSRGCSSWSELYGEPYK